MVPFAPLAPFRPVLLALGSLIALSGCMTAPSEATPQKTLSAERLDASTTLAFADESAVLTDEHRLQLDALLQGTHNGSLVVNLTSHDDRPVNTRRQDRIAEYFRAHGVQHVTSQSDVGVPHRTIRVEVTAIHAMEPGCPDWSGPQYGNFGNVPLTNLGCASATNLSRMIEDPRDLLGQDYPTGVDAERGAAVVKSYRESASAPPESEDESASSSSATSDSESQ